MNSTTGLHCSGCTAVPTMLSAQPERGAILSWFMPLLDRLQWGGLPILPLRPDSAGVSSCCQRNTSLLLENWLRIYHQGFSPGQHSSICPPVTSAYCNTMLLGDLIAVGKSDTDVIGRMMIQIRFVTHAELFAQKHLHDAWSDGKKK